MSGIFVWVSLFPILGGFLLDQILGDPQWLHHPVRLIGKLVRMLEKLLRRIFPAMPTGECLAGTVLAVTVPLLVVITVNTILLLAARFHILLWMAVETLFCYFLLAARSLKDEAMQVYSRLETGNLPGARKTLARIVGRDTVQMEEKEIIKAAVETVSENTSDGVVAPLFYLFLGGSVLGWGYKAVNTLDSMVGYQNKEYVYFGKVSAKLDDLLNLIPARISALIMVVGAFLCRMDGKSAWHIWRRDHGNHASPNSAHTEAVCAGALGILLGGGASYWGEWKEKPTIGDSLREPEIMDISRSCKLMRTTAFLSLLFFAILKTVVLWLVAPQ